ncbi:MAG: FkbM family methyltransferase [Desulfobacterales bacterium]|jgi:FkbM family methyltransferase|nr:FkbM family methyltransferase [Desulfobacterales bacterium]
MMDLRTRLGLLRSSLIYVWRPLQRARVVRFYRRFVPPGALCFDVGAHLGSRTRAFLALGARVLAVEPQPACAAYLRKRWGRHPRFALVAQAVGAEPGAARLFVNRLNPAISSLAPAAWRAAMADAAAGPERWDREVAVAVTTLDRLIAAFGLPSFCKIDVEGFEVEVLAGLSRPLPALSFEFISFESDRAKACLRRLAALGGYRFNWAFREKLRLEHSTWVEAAAVARMLDTLGSRVLSGDVYARLPVK